VTVFVTIQNQKLMLNPTNRGTKYLTQFEQSFLVKPGFPGSPLVFIL